MNVYEIGDVSYTSRMATWRILHYSPKNPERDIVDVEFEYRDTLGLSTNVKFTRRFYYLTNEQLAERIIKDEKIDLSFCYIKNLNLKQVRDMCGREIVFPSFNAEYACFDGDTSFEGTVIGDGKISFKNAVFGNGDVSFFQTVFGDSDISFYNVDFQRGAVSFSEAIFGDGDLDFEYAVFGPGNAAFTGVDFGAGDVHFGGAVFERGQVIFQNTKFGDGDVYFDYTSFGDGNAFFDNAKFGTGNVVFDHANFNKGKVSFINADFSMGDTLFKDTKFGLGSLDFTGALAESVIFDDCQFNNHDKLTFAFVNSLRIERCISSKTLEISGAKIMSLKDTMNLGCLYCDWDINKVAEAIAGNDDSIQEKGRQYSLLKQNYHKIGAYEYEDQAFVEYMRCRRRELRSVSLRGLDRLIDTIGGYGTRPGKVAMTMLAVWFSFGILFTILDLTGGALTTGMSESWVNGFYFSGVTFLTIGYGDIAPLLLPAKLLAPLEGMLGLFLMSYFTVSVVRKTLR